MAKYTPTPDPFGGNHFPPPSVLFGALDLLREPGADRAARVEGLKHCVELLEKLAEFTPRIAIQPTGRASDEMLRDVVLTLRVVISLLSDGVLVEMIADGAPHLMPRVKSAIGPALENTRQLRIVGEALLEERRVAATGEDTPEKALRRGLQSAANHSAIEIGSFAEYADEDAGE